MGQTAIAAFFWLLALTQLPSLRPLARYLPYPEVTILLVLACTALGIFILIKPPKALQHLLLSIFSTAWPSALIITALSIAIAIGYPFADGLKTIMGGSDADDAIQLGATALWNFTNPYQLRTYLGGPLSPGPGWLMLWGPLVGLGLQPLGPVCALAFAVWALRRIHTPWVALNTFTLLWASCLTVWELAVVGNDVITFGLVLVGVVALLTQLRLTFLSLLVLAFVVGCLATTRVNFFYLPFLVGFALLAVWPKRAFWVAGAGTLTTLAWHGVFYALAPDPDIYSPLNNIQNGQALMTPSLTIGALMLLSVTGVAMLYHWRWWPPFTHIALGLGTPLGILALAQLASHGQLARWEGITFFMPALPVAILAILSLWPLHQGINRQPKKQLKISSISATKNQKAPAKPLVKRSRSR